jgi:hypothetical protein
VAALLAQLGLRAGADQIDAVVVAARRGEQLSRQVRGTLGGEPDLADVAAQQRPALLAGRAVGGLELAPTSTE